MRKHHDHSRLQASRGPAGFTLIELVVTLSIMAVLAAYAMPRYMSMQRDARIGHLGGVRGSAVSSAMLIHATLLARRNQPDPTPCPAGGIVANNQAVGAGTVCTEGGVVNTTNGYPSSSPLGTAGIISASGMGNSFTPSVAELAADGYVVTVSGSTTAIQRIDATSPATCGFTYTEAPAAGTAATFSATVTSGC